VFVEQGGDVGNLEPVAPDSERGELHPPACEIRAPGPGRQFHKGKTA
jgi:hypothetical protein